MQMIFDMSLNISPSYSAASPVPLRPSAVYVSSIPLRYLTFGLIVMVVTHSQETCARN